MTISSAQQQTLLQLAERLLDVSPLARALSGPARVAAVADVVSALPADASGVGEILERMAHRLGTPPLEWRPAEADKFTTFEQAISEHLAIDPTTLQPFVSSGSGARLVDSASDEARRNSFASAFPPHDVRTPDGVIVRSYAGGPQGAPAVILAAPCGMPAPLSTEWLTFFAQNFFVATWETRGLFGDVQNGEDMAYDWPTQSQDLVAVMDYFDLRHAHVMGVCGGAVVAAAAAAQQPERITSVSLWHGDFCGLSCDRTVHQKRMAELMAFAGQSKSAAGSVQKLFQHPSGFSGQKHKTNYLTLYPYASAELLHAYGRLNGAIMNANITKLLKNISQPTLVVTSDDDETAHPDGSRYVADQLACATLHVRRSGDHLSVFDAGPPLTDLVLNFVLSHQDERRPRRQTSIN